MKTHNNELLLKRNMRRVMSFLEGNEMNELKCLNLVGTNIKQLKEYVEAQFQEGMTWDNIGHDWKLGFHVNGHKFNMTMPLQKALVFHYTNFLPMPIVH